MHTEGNSQTNLNGWQNIGKVTEWIITQPLSLAERFIYLAVARRTVGYTQYTSEITSYAKLAELSGTSIDAVKRTMPKLIKSGYIIKISTNQVANAGKVAYKYQLNMRLPNFPSLGKLKEGREAAKLKSKFSADYMSRFFISPVDGSVQPIFLNDSSRNPIWMSEIFMPDAEHVLPTAEQLSTYLEELKCASSIINP